MPGMNPGMTVEETAPATAVRSGCRASTCHGERGLFQAPAAQRGRVVVPIRSLSMAWAAWRPSRIAQTTRLWPRRMSPAA